MRIAWLVLVGFSLIGYSLPAQAQARAIATSTRARGDAGTQVSGVGLADKNRRAEPIEYVGDRRVAGNSQSVRVGPDDGIPTYQGDRLAGASEDVQRPYAGNTYSAASVGRAVSRPYGGYALAAPPNGGASRPGAGRTSVLPPVPVSAEIEAFATDLTRAGVKDRTTAMVYATTAVTEARRQNIPPALVFGVMQQESQFNPRAKSVKGALGLMQIMPKSWLTRDMIQRYGDNLYDPVTNIRYGVHALRFFAEMTGGDWHRTLQKYSGNAENYSAKVMRHIDRNAESLCRGQSLDACAGLPLWYAFLDAGQSGAKPLK